MGAKKKVEVPPPPPQPIPEKAVNNILKIITSEGAEFRVSEQLLVRFSSKIKVLAENSKDGTIKLQEVDGECFDMIRVYLEMHNQKEPNKIIVPIRSNQSLKHIMEEADAQLVEKIMAKGDLALQKMMDASLALDIESLRKRLACGVAIKLMRSTVEELKEEYGLDEYNFDEETLRVSIRPLIEQLKKNGMEQEN